MARIVLNTFGSLGDLHPFLALALALQRRGHAPLLATSAVYRTKIESSGVEFAAVRPDVGELIHRPDFVEKLWDPKLGTEYLLRDYLIPQVQQSYEDLAAISAGADLLLTHSAGYAGPIAGEALKIQWASVALQPAVFFSARDPSVVAPAPWLRHLYWLGPAFYRLLLAFAERRIERWIGPILDLRKRLNLPPSARNPVTLGQFSPYGSLALFSRYFAGPQSDWPINTEQPGFLFYDQLGSGMPGSSKGDRAELPPAWGEFLERGEPPVLFTLGSSAVLQAGSFFTESVGAAERLGARAILLVGRQEKTLLPTSLPPSILVADYLPYSKVMPRVSAIVHQGGIGTTAQSLRAGKPMLVVPWAHDQPDNAARLQRLGVARSLPRHRYQASTAARELKALLDNRQYAARAKAVATQISAENGEERACDAVERLLLRT